MIQKETIFISGTDTDAGKSYATGWMAKTLMEQGRKVITQKMVQTGNQEFSEDIDVHRRIMGTGMLAEDLNHLTAPQIFTYPASAHLAARIDGRRLDLDAIDIARKELEAKYDIVLVEGAGGLMVPLFDDNDYLAIDYAADRHFPVALVTNGKLGSINHTLLSFEALQHRNMEVKYVIYNTHFDYDPIVCGESQRYIREAAQKRFPGVQFLVLPTIRTIY